MLHTEYPHCRANLEALVGHSFVFHSFSERADKQYDYLLFFRQSRERYGCIGIDWKAKLRLFQET